MNIKDIVKLDKTALKAVLEEELRKRGYNPINEPGYLYAEGTHPVMLIAHMDTVHHDNCTIVCESEDGKYLMSPQGIGGDDRCGIYMVLKTIDEVNCSVVFTEDEEVGCVGAGKFAQSGHKPANLNYIIEYDRKGKDDAVFYSCDNPEFTKFICDEEIGFKEETGSCSDISRIAPALGVAAVNLSSGYYSQHTLHEYINVQQMENNIQRGLQLIRKPCEKFDYIEKVYKYSGYKYSGTGSGYKSYGKYDDYDDYCGYNWYRGYYGGSQTKNGITVSNSNKKDPWEGKEEDIEIVNDMPEPPEPPIDIAAAITYDFGMNLLPDKHYISNGKTNLYPKSWLDYAIDEFGNVYAYHEDTELYYPLIAEYKAYHKDGTPLIFDVMDAEDFNYAYLADINKISEYIDELSEFDEENGTDFAVEFLEELQDYKYRNYAGR